MEVGLLDEFIRDMKNSLDVLKNDFIKGRTPQEGRYKHILHQYRPR